MRRDTWMRSWIPTWLRRRAGGGRRRERGRWMGVTLSLAVLSAALYAMVLSLAACGAEDTASGPVGEASQAAFTLGFCGDFGGVQLPDPAQPSLTGWTAVGPTLQAGVDLSPTGQTQGTAQVFSLTSPSHPTVKCFYIRRDVSAMATENEVMCIDQADCSICAWQQKMSGTDPAGTLLGSMAIPGDPALDDCSGCHVTGPLLPRPALFNAMPGGVGMMNACVAAGGPTWLFGPPPSWAKPIPGSVVLGPALVSCASCHAGFLPIQANQGDYCDVFADSLQVGGSMHNFVDQPLSEYQSVVHCPSGGADAGTDTGADGGTCVYNCGPGEPTGCQTRDWMSANHAYVVGTPSGQRGNFALSAGAVNGVVKGNFHYADLGAAEQVVATDVTSYTITGPTDRRIQGHATVNGASGFTYTIDATDNGAYDSFSLSVSDGYHAYGVLSQIQLTIQTCP